MSDTNNRTYIIIGVVVVFLLIWFYYNRKVENFDGTNELDWSTELDRFYDGASTRGVEDYLVDNMVCSKKCCGDQWPTPFDGLDAEEIQQSILKPGFPGPFVRTNMTCANGIDGVGCPCIPARAYEFLANRGDGAHNIRDIEPTLFIRNDVGFAAPNDVNGPLYSGVNWGKLMMKQTDKQTDQQEMSPLEQVQQKLSMFSDTVKLTDIDRTIPLGNISSVRSSAPMNGSFR
uniref:Uncharacterized protein n=1 Tax=viral metagenome TaxID=1070528 RepID=A0A6C0CD31_9ZZZZ